MKLEEAIKILTTHHRDQCTSIDSDTDDALQLGIEALKRRKYQSEQTSKWADIILPGETRE